MGPLIFRARRRKTFQNISFCKNLDNLQKVAFFEFRTFLFVRLLFGKRLKNIFARAKLFSMIKKLDFFGALNVILKAKEVTFKSYNRPSCYTNYTSGSSCRSYRCITYSS